MSQSKVTLVVSPRERFSYTQRSLESIYENTTYPFELIYIDGGSPKKTHNYLKEAAQKYGFKLIRTNHYLTPNQARNIGLSHVSTDYIVFLDNDVLVFQPNWLEILVNCGDRTGAAVVTPLTLQGEACDTVHHVGGEIILKELADGRRWLLERRPYMRLPMAKVPQLPEPGPTELSEFHCVFARRDLFDVIGPLDEKLLSMAEETDFCLSVLKAGKQIYLEPNCAISYVPPMTMQWSDFPFFFLRWSSSWCEASLQRMQQKHNLDPTSPGVKNYRIFVHHHRLLAFSGSELRSKALLLDKDLTLVGKAKHFTKKLLRRYMNQRALSLGGLDSEKAMA